MTNTRISDLAPGGAVTATDRFPAVESAGVGPVTKTGTQLRTWAATAASDPFSLAQYDNVGDCTAALQAVIDTCFGTIGSPHGTSFWLNKPFLLPPGRFNISAPLNLTQVQGGVISGSGRFTTQITQTTPGASLFVTNGFEYSTVADMLLTGSAGGVCFDLDWNNIGVALQSNTFSNIRFEGGAYGLRIGNSGFMGSETLVQNCFFHLNTISGLSTQNFNALQTTVIGGNFSFCARGIDILAGGVPSIIGAGFQANTDYDIYILNSAHVGMMVSGCRTESINFIRCGAAPCVSLHDCTQRNSASGVFANVNDGLIVDGCWSDNGQIVGGDFTSVQIRHSGFSRTDYLNAFTGSILVDGQPRTRVITGNHTLSYNDSLGSRIESISASGVTVNVPADIINTGFAVDITQKGAGQVTVAAVAGTPRTNLLLYSNLLTASTWGLAGVTRSASAVLTPNGYAMTTVTSTVGAHPDGAGVFNTTSITLTPSESLAISVYVKKTSYNYVQLNLSTDNSGHYVAVTADLSTNTITQTAVGPTSGTLVSSSITSVGSGIYRLGFVGSFTQTTAYVSCGFAGAATGNTFDVWGNVNFTATGAETGLFGDFQMEPNTSITAFIPTAETPITVGQATIHTPSSLTTRAQYSTISIRQWATNDWVASGDLT